MLKSLAKPAEDMHPSVNGYNNGHHGANGGGGGPMSASQLKAMQQHQHQMTRQQQGRGTGSIPEIFGDRPMDELMKFPDGVTVSASCMSCVSCVVIVLYVVCVLIL